jgi:hypothetical protein
MEPALCAFAPADGGHSKKEQNMTQNTNRLSEADLAQFTGSETLYRHGLARSVLYTEGAQFLAEKAGAYWLLDEIAFAQRPGSKVAAEPFQHWKLTVSEGGSAHLSCDDGNGNIVLAKRIPFTDFPLPTLSLYVANKVIMLPGEY